MVIDIRGTHGSGKSHIIRKLMSYYTWKPFMGEGRATKKGPVKIRHLGFECKQMNAIVLGNYAEGVPSGGCDNIQDPEEVVRRVKLFNTTHKYVFMEGILVSHTFARYSELAFELGDYWFCFLNTPLEVCIERVKSRNANSASTNIRPFNDLNIRKDYRQIYEVVRNKCIAAGHKVVVLNYRCPIAQLNWEVGLCLPRLPST